MNHNARWGMRFFIVYAAVYLAFVLLNALAPSAMERTPFAGVNWAVISGMGLIALAFIMALWYGLICAANERNTNADRDKRS